MRKSSHRHFLIAGLLLFSLTVSGAWSNFPTAVRVDIKNVTFYHTYGYLDEDEWVIPLKLYVSESRPVQERAITALVRNWYDLDEEQTEIFRSRISAFVADSKSREEVVFGFDRDPEGEAFRLLSDNGNPTPAQDPTQTPAQDPTQTQSQTQTQNPNPNPTPIVTNRNGIKNGTIRLGRERAEQLLAQQNSMDGWLTIRAVSEGHEGTGRIQLIPPYGLSVISDIDDTVKITEMPAGTQIVLRNTFFKPYQAAPGMADLYQLWNEAAFHYVSGTPRQFFNPLKEYLFHEDQGFPPGSMHMKNVQKNFLSPETWRNMGELLINDDYTFDQKSGQIIDILEAFPERRFILVSDSGERDPEIYREMMRRFPEQIEKVYIRDVVNDWERNPERLEGMEIIPARTVTRGVSQF